MAYKSPFQDVVKRPQMPPAQPADTKPTLSYAPTQPQAPQPAASTTLPAPASSMGLPQSLAGLLAGPNAPSAQIAQPAPGGEPNPCPRPCNAYPEGHPCKQILNCAGTTQTGACPPGTPAGPASCCPAGQVYRTDTQTCEPPDQRSLAGQETCDESQHPSPRECYWCNFDTAQWERGWCGNTGSGGVGGGGVGGGGGFVMPNYGNLESDTIWQAILRRLNGESRYTPEVMSSLLGETRLTAERQAQQQQAQANESLTQRGMLRAPLAAAANRDIQSSMYNSVLQAQNVINKAKIDADYQDKTAAIEEGIAWLNSLRTYIASMNATAAQKAAAMANIQLGYARLQQELAMMREQYAQQLQLAMLNNGGGGNPDNVNNPGSQPGGYTGGA